MARRARTRTHAHTPHPHYVFLLPELLWDTDGARSRCQEPEPAQGVWSPVTQLVSGEQWCPRGILFSGIPLQRLSVLTLATVPHLPLALSGPP